jgi:hypothetical protein
MQGVTLFIREVVAFIIGNQVDNRPVRPGGRLVEYDAPVLNACSQGAHVATIRTSTLPRNTNSRHVTAPPSPVDCETVDYASQNKKGRKQSPPAFLPDCV